ncbi:hypothetical protein ACEPAF_9603 [Sanghuangporus sanghuang]
MHAIAALFALLLTFATQSVFCFFKNVNFSTPEQCGPFTVDFSNAPEPPVLPLSLTIVPISAIPISIQLPADSWDNSTNAGTARITFLPFSSGTRFIASLDDGTGASVALVSDVIAVQDSNATTCLGPNQKSFPFYFIHDGDLNQCSRFNVTFNPSMIKNPPAIRAFLPRSFSFPVNATDTPVATMTLGPHSSSNEKDKRDDDKGNDNGKGKDKDDGDDDDDDDDDDDKSDKSSSDKSDNNDSGKDDNDNDKDDNNGTSSNSGNNNGGSNNNSENSNNGSGNPFNNSSNNDPYSHGPFNISSKEYLLNIIHGFQAVLTFDDGDGHRGSSKLFTAGGTSSSPSGCFKESFNIPSSTPDTSSSSSAGEGGKSDGLSRTGKIVISVLGTIIGVSLAVILFILCRKRRKARKDLEKTSFVFTEDVDMGSSFATTFASRIRARISHMTYGKRSLRSYRSYGGGKDGGSIWIPTSPIGSPAPLANSPQAEKRSSWIDFSAVLGNVPPEGLEMSSARYSRTLRAGDMDNPITLPSLESNYPAPRVSTDMHRPDKPDVPAPAVSRSSESSRFLMGSGYLSSRSSGTGFVMRKNTRLFIRNSLPAQTVNSNGRRHSAAILSTNFSSSGYMPSRSSSATMDREPEPRQVNNEIYVSSPIRPAPNIPDSISSSQSDSGTVQRPSTVITRDISSRISILKGNLRRDGPPRERGRILPFPTVSLRVSRSPRSSPG